MTAEPDVEALSWSVVDTTGPDAREDHTWTVDRAGETAYLFGGRDGGTVFDDLWAYDLASDRWSQLTVPGPTARFGHEAVWHDELGLVIFAGQAGTTFFNELWAYDPQAARWTLLPAGGSPPVARYGSCASIGPDDRLWISHGFTADGARFADTRAYDFANGTWSDETPPSSAPVNRCLHGCWWTDAGHLALYGGQTTGVVALGDHWLLMDGSWTRSDGTLPADRNLYARTRLDGGTLVFGGQGLDAGYLADIWLFVDGEPDAIRLAPDGQMPDGRSAAEFVHDPDRSRVLMFGGRNGSGAFAEMWQLTGSQFSGR